MTKGIMDVNKLNRLRSILRELKSVVVAFSGGADSSFLLKAARDTLPKKDVMAVTAVSDTYTKAELETAKNFAKSLDARHRIIFTNELKDRNFTKNQADRCYYCKKELFANLKEIAERNRLNFVIDASNVDDRKDYRPGSRAKTQFGVRSPLQEAGITKGEIRRFSRKLGLGTWDLPAMACLASRIPYGVRVERDVLYKIERAEESIRLLGIRQVRVRYHNDIARIEVTKNDIKKFCDKTFCGKIVKHLRSLGFKYIALDLEGYRTGSLNEVL